MHTPDDRRILGEHPIGYSENTNYEPYGLDKEKWREECSYELTGIPQISIDSETPFRE